MRKFRFEDKTHIRKNRVVSIRKSIDFESVLCENYELITDWGKESGRITPARDIYLGLIHNGHKVPVFEVTEITLNSGKKISYTRKKGRLWFRSVEFTPKYLNIKVFPQQKH
jgi:hypothetical protein